MHEADRSGAEIPRAPANSPGALLRTIAVVMGCVLAGCKPAPVPDPGAPQLLETRDAWVVRHGPLEVQWAKDGPGGPARITADGREFQPDPALPPVFAEVWSVEARAPFSDRVNGVVLPKTERGIQWQAEREAGVVTVRASGTFDWTEGDAGPRLDWTVAWRFEKGRPGARIEVGAVPSGDWEGRVIRELRWHLPLGLDHRKRVAQGGDQGVDWDTRYYYNFFVSPRRQLMRYPEVNYWRHFAVEQESPETFRIWRAQSDTTAPLVMQRGVKAAGWICVYDREGGFFAASEELASRAPKALRVDADGGGTLSLQLVPSTATALHPSDHDFENRVAGIHALELMPFGGPWDKEEKSAALRALWGVERLASDPGTDKSIAGEDWLRETPGAADALPPVFGGVPLPRGACPPDAGMRLFQGGRELPVQWSPLAFWPDGSVKWAQLIFPLASEALLEPGRGSGGTLHAAITLRDGAALPMELHYGPEVEPARVRNPVDLRRKEDAGPEVALGNGILHLELAQGRQWLAVLRRHGRDLLRHADDPLAFVDYLHLDENSRPLDAHARGQVLAGPLEVTDLEVEEAGPIRAVVRLTGRTGGEEPVKVILRIEAYAGCEWLRIWKTAEFLDADPRQRMVSAMGLSLPLALESAGARLMSPDGSFPIAEASSESLLQFSPAGYRNRIVGPDGLERTVAEGFRSPGWIGVADSFVGATVIQRYFWQRAPRENRAVLDPEPRLTAYFHPDAAPVMDVRRYSDFPHRSQGESVQRGTGPDNFWVRDFYYKADPFMGISRTFETLWGFHDPDCSAAEIQSVAADFHSRPLIYAGEEAYRAPGVALPWANPETYPAITRNLANVSRFWLFNQAFWNWFGPWKHGDTVHAFHSGQGRILSPDALRAQLDLPEDERYSGGALEEALDDYYPDNDWAFDNGRWGWSMTEKLPGQFWQMQYLRTGDRDVFFQAEAAAEYSRDVVIRHHGRWFGSGTRHGVQQWSDGNHEERQTVALEWRHHYLLTGDKRSADVINRLAREYYLQTDVSGRADPSGRLPGLLMHWEMTGEPASRLALESYLRAMIHPRGIQFPTVDIRTGQKTADGAVNDGSMFFHDFGAMHAVLEYLYLTDDVELQSELTDALVRMARHFVEAEAPVTQARLAIGFAAGRAQDPEVFLEHLDREILQTRLVRQLFQAVTENPEFWSGPNAILEGSSTGSWPFMNIIPYWTSVWEAREVPLIPPDGEREIMEARETKGRPRVLPQLSWQDEFDAPEFDVYFERWRPWSESFVHPRPASGNLD